MTINHERCSELLGSFVRGELAPEETGAVEAHLATCDECELEKRGLEALTAEPDEFVLTDLERTALHRTLAAARSTSRREVVPARRNVWTRVAPALGAAALIVFAVFGLTDFIGGGDESGDDMQSEGAGGLESDPEEVEVDVGGPAIAAPGTRTTAAAEALPTQEEPFSDEEGADQSDRAFTAVQGSVARFDPDAGAFTQRDLKRYAARQSPFTQASFEYRARDADEALGHSHLLALAGAASTEREAETIRRCGEQVLEQDFPILPVYAGFGRLDDRDVLVLGYVFARDEALDRFLVWVWPQRSCDIPVLIQDGRIRP